MSNHFDYIITGSGCAGLSLLHGMMRHPFFNNKAILVIEQSAKTSNDRTWCFWEQEPGPFEEIVHHRWSQIDFYSNYFSARFDIAPYSYKMIRGIDFYRHVLSGARQHSDIQFLTASVQSIHNNNGMGVVTTASGTYTARYVFNSILFGNGAKDENAKQFVHQNIPAGNAYFLLQHFKGWVIETPAAFFDARIATFMDFRVGQQYGTTFVYVLPLSPTRALVEYTLFTRDLLQQEEYDGALQQYIHDKLGCSSYEVKEEEFGIIPMTNYRFPKGEASIVHIGTAGGQTKASSGFTFRFIQRHTAQLIEALVHDSDPHITLSFAAKRFRLYDSTLLHILHHRKLGGDRIFADLFKKNPPQRVLRFLDNETSVAEELRIMSSVPTGVFLPAALQELVK